MKNDDFIDKLRSFMNESTECIGMTFTGCYTMGDETFLKAFRHYLETGENVLDEHAEITHLSWGDDILLEGPHQVYLPKAQCDRILQLLAGDSFWSLYDACTEDRIKELINLVHRSIQYRRDKKNKKKRRNQACRITADPEVRKRIFERDGEKCAICGAEKNLTIDHIEPVSKGGEDTDENFQPLCIVCNASKGNR